MRATIKLFPVQSRATCCTLSLSALVQRQINLNLKQENVPEGALVSFRHILYYSDFYHRTIDQHTEHQKTIPGREHEKNTHFGQTHACLFLTITRVLTTSTGKTSCLALCECQIAAPLDNPSPGSLAVCRCWRQGLISDIYTHRLSAYFHHCQYAKFRILLE